METELNSKDYVAFARRFVKETVAVSYTHLRAHETS